MTEESFWNLIRNAGTHGPDSANFLAQLEAKLFDLPIEDMLDFLAWLRTFLDRANDRRLIIAGSIIRGVIGSGGLIGDDGFLYFRTWLIAQGREAFQSALVNPDSLAELRWFDECSVSSLTYMEKLLYVANKPFIQKSGGKPLTAYKEVLPSWKPPCGSSIKSTGLKHAEFWTNKDIDQLETSFPRLTFRTRHANH